MDNRQVRQILFILLIAAMAGLLFWNLRFFVPALLGAYTLYILLRQPLHFLVSRWRWHRTAAAAVLMLASAAVFALPVNWVFQLLGGRFSAAMQDSQGVWQNVETLAHSIETRYNISIWTPETLKNVTGWAYEQARTLVSATFDGLLTFMVAYLILWFMLTNGRQMETSFSKWLPLQTENVAYVRRQLNNLVYSNAVGIPLMGVVQGFAGLLAYWLAGVPEPWLWFAVTFVAGMMPVFGAMLAYVPLSIILLANGSPLTALFVFLYGMIVIGSVDNLARMWLLNKIGHAHPLVTFFGVIAGLKLFGFIGFVFGPILISLLLLLFQIYEKEFGGGGAARAKNHPNG